MVAYEYYWHDEIKGFELIGVLPERRNDSNRVTQESILGFGKKFWAIIWIMATSFSFVLVLIKRQGKFPALSLRWGLTSRTKNQKEVKRSRDKGLPPCFLRLPSHPLKGLSPFLR